MVKVQATCLLTLIQVRLPSDDQPPKPKRRRIQEEGDETSTSAQPPGLLVKVIEANSVILGSKSEYFGAILTRGEWTESQSKVVVVDLASVEGEYVILR